MKGLLPKLLPHFIAVIIFLIVTVILCSPVLQGKVVNQHDILGWKGMAQQSFEFKEKHGHFPLWTNSLFSGMPTYTIAMESTRPIFTNYIYTLITLGLPKPLNFFFLSCLCFYFLTVIFRIKPGIGIMGALAYAFCTFDTAMVSAGHDTQMQAVALAPAIIGSLLLILRKQYLLGSALLATFFGFQVGTQHLQIMYYTGITVAIVLVFYVIHNWKNTDLKSLIISLSVALGAAILGFLTFAVSMLPLREYAKETMRGGQSQLLQQGNNANKTKGGLDKDYAFSWSYGIGETFTIMVPGIYGGSNGGREHKGSTTFSEKLSEAGIPEDQAIQMANQYSYWGDQPFTSGPVYYGAVICFLFILGMVYLKTWHKWWLLTATIIGIFLAWGKNFSALNYFLFDHLPLYNKFRAPSMALVIPQLAFPLMAVLTLNQLFTDSEKREILWNKFKRALFITAGITGLLLVLYMSLSFKSVNDNKIKEGFVNSMISQSSKTGQPSAEVQLQAQSFGQSALTALKDDRKSLYGGDLMRTIFFILLSAGLLAAYLKNKLKPLVVTSGLILLTAIDLLTVDSRYLNDDSFIENSEFESGFTPTEADQQIMADANKPFRVFDNTDQQNGPYQSSRASYFFNSVGGYHPAKLSLYQDLIEHQLSKGNMAAFNMLNTRYFIFPNPSTGKPVAQLNPNAFGPAWLVKGIKFVTGPDAEMAALDSTSLKDTAVVQQSFKKNPGFQQPDFDTSSSIKLAEYLNDRITYTFNSKKNQFAVFSEIYYPLGWNAYIDDRKSDYIKTDYALRGMGVPAGKHSIVFKFEPATYKTGDTLSFISSLLTMGLLLTAIIIEIRKRRNLPVK